MFSYFYIINSFLMINFQIISFLYIKKICKQKSIKTIFIKISCKKKTFKKPIGEKEIERISAIKMFPEVKKINVYGFYFIPTYPFAAVLKDKR